ncbi:MAG: paraquat-inducible protein A [Deltaproteobacteria bacterium]|nr:paraquat-inducible protein A [Deltaproteobacteria bacterium]
MVKNVTTARQAGFVLCRKCHLLSAQKTLPDNHHCPRCGVRLRLRKPESLARTWALLITSLIFLFPANLLPIMTVISLGEKEPNTIMQGIQYFIQSGTYVVAFLIFFASILVPIAKVTGIMLVLLSIRRKWKGWLRHKTLMFRMIRFIGRWSMLDIFVIALMVAIVEFGTLNSIHAAPAATYFAGVVVSTMLAANTFDTRLIWEETDR